MRELNLLLLLLMLIWGKPSWRSIKEKQENWHNFSCFRWKIFKKTKINGSEYWLPCVMLRYLMLQGNYSCRNSERLAFVFTGQMQILTTLSSINNDSNKINFFYSNNDNISNNTNNNKLSISFTILIPNKKNLVQLKKKTYHELSRWHSNTHTKHLDLNSTHSVEEFLKQGKYSWIVRIQKKNNNNMICCLPVASSTDITTKMHTF